jgi:tRNA dimethylallyltransferase
VPPEALSSALAHGPLLCLVGPTAVGKTAFALDLAEALDAEVVSMDSMQVYRRMDVGTAKPGPDERARVRHHGLDLVEPSERYDVRRFLGDLQGWLADIAGRGKRALLVGGAGLYLRVLERGLFEGPAPDPVLRTALNARAASEGAPVLHAELARRDPASAERIHPNDTKRVVRALEVLEQTGRRLSEWQAQWAAQPRPDRLRLVGLRRPRPALEARIADRIEAMLEAGWVEEAVAIRASTGFGPTAIQALGYREVLAHADGELERGPLAALLAQRTRQFVRRQSTWFRSFQDIHWLDLDEHAARALAEARRVLLSGS